MSYLYVKWNSFELRGCPPTFTPLKHVWVSLATPGTEACDAVGGAFRLQWREWPAKGFLGESRPSAYLANAAVCNICITSCLPLGGNPSTDRRLTSH